MNMMTRPEAIQLLEAVNAGYVNPSHTSVRYAVEALGHEEARSIMYFRGKDLLDLAIEDRTDVLHEHITRDHLNACRFPTG